VSSLIIETWFGEEDVSRLSLIELASMTGRTPKQVLADLDEGARHGFLRRRLSAPGVLAYDAVIPSEAEQ
jgi:hypothetical protein